MFKVLLGALCAVSRAALLPVLYTGCIQCTAHYAISDTGQVFHPSPLKQHYRVLLKVMALSRNVGDHLNTIRKSYLCNLPQSRIRLFGSGCINTGTNSSALGTTFQSSGFFLRRNFFATLFHQLIYCWHILLKMYIHKIFQIRLNLNVLSAKSTRPENETANIQLFSETEPHRIKYFLEFPHIYFFIISFKKS